MGRQVRRVPANFDWPLGQPWPGFVNPFKFPPCDACAFPGAARPTGLTPEAHAVAATFYPSAMPGPRAIARSFAWHDKLAQAEVDHLVALGRLRVWRPDEGWVSTPRSADEVNAAQRRAGLFGHDAVDRDILVRFRCERLGIVIECPACGGHGTLATDEQRAVEASWTPTDPPTGPWWQVWETITEGSPITPAFATPEMLARWCVENPFGADEGASYEDWLAFIRAPGVVPTFVATGAGVVSGVEDAGRGDGAQRRAGSPGAADAHG